MKPPVPTRQAEMRVAIAELDGSTARVRYFGPCRPCEPVDTNEPTSARVNRPHRLIKGVIGMFR
jgi:hypothetical protein